MIYILYLILAICVIGFSIRLSYYVDELDKKTNLSGAFIGGVMLAAVTSLPELFTSIASTVFLDEVQLVSGNILGSNIFNTAVLGLLIFMYLKPFKKAKITTSHQNTLKFLMILYGIIFIAISVGRDFTFFGVSIFSIIIMLIYVIGVRKMSGDEGTNNSVESECNLTVKQIYVRFIILSLGLIACSIGITIVTDMIAKDLNLGVTLAGALFLGVATSLPEVTASISLVAKGNFNAMIGNLVGSNLFNFCILFLADIMYIKGSIYIPSNQVYLLIIFGIICTVFSYSILKMKKESDKEINKQISSLPYALASIIVVAGYVTYLAISI
ncbi:MAG: cation transporter [Clostridium sp.]|uniref:sodium:calcium antiporter n=1 Tax=Clostridium sp. TaxID=1506 RepID=UPI0030285AA8